MRQPPFWVFNYYDNNYLRITLTILTIFDESIDLASETNSPLYVHENEYVSS